MELRPFEHELAQRHPARGFGFEHRCPGSDSADSVDMLLIPEISFRVFRLLILVSIWMKNRKR